MKICGLGFTNCILYVSRHVSYYILMDEQVILKNKLTWGQFVIGVDFVGGHSVFNPHPGTQGQADAGVGACQLGGQTAKGGGRKKQRM